MREPPDSGSPWTKTWSPRAIDLNDDIWTIRHIALYRHCEKTAVNKAAAAPGFPTPIEDKERYRLWLGSEIRAHYNSRESKSAAVAEPALAFTRVSRGHRKGMAA